MGFSTSMLVYPRVTEFTELIKICGNVAPEIGDSTNRIIESQEVTR